MAKKMESLHDAADQSLHDGLLPGREVDVGHGKPLDGVEQKHLNHPVHGHIAHSPRTHFKE